MNALTAVPAGWLRPSVKPERLEADLRARGYGLWWRQSGNLQLTTPEGTTLEFSESTSLKTLRAAYEAAQERAAARAS